MSVKSNYKDQVVSFTLSEHSMDGSRRLSLFAVKNSAVYQMPGAQWKPLPPSSGAMKGSTLSTRYKSGRVLTIDMEADEHVALLEAGRLIKLMEKIMSGQMPGEALKRQLTRTFDLSPLPKLKSKKSRRPIP